MENSLAVKRFDRILTDALGRNNVLSESDLHNYVADATQEGSSLRDFLVNNEIVTERQILIALSQSLSLEMIDVSDIIINQGVLDQIPIKFSWYYKFLPIKIENNILTIASAVPLDVKIVDEIRMNIGFSVIVVLCEQTKLYEAIKKYYGLASDTIDKILQSEDMEDHISSSDTGQWIEDLERQPEDPTVSGLVNQIILEAYKKRATDIHVEPYRNRVRFRYRIDGVLVDANLPDKVKHFIPQILSRIKILANLSITEKRLPQDGSAVVKTKDQNLDLRVSTMPTPRGESMVIRILPTKVMLFSLEKLGFNSDNLDVFQELLSKPHGIVFITGPTGSGKTTTLYACLNEINSSERKIITIEDPIEYEMDGISQVQVNPKVNFTFSAGLRSILRHDPDILMVGEVRDVETAEIAVRTALTGHLVFSTLHTNDASSGVTRLVDMGVESYLVASSVEAFVAQRLIRTICPKCKEELVDIRPGVKEDMAASLGINDLSTIKVYHGKGCDYCNKTGYYGRKAIYEILMLNDAIRSVILEKPRANEIKKVAIQEGLITLRQNGWKAVLEGVTTPMEVLNVTVKDEDADLDYLEVSGSLDSQEMISKLKEFRFLKARYRGDWVEKNQYEGRIYKRAFDPIDIRYKLLSPDPDNPEALISDEIEHPTICEDISAGGLRFMSKTLLPVGSILELRVDLGKGYKALDCLAKVCRVEEDSLEDIYTIMTYYLDISSADRAMIDRYVKKRIKEKTK